VKLDSGSIMRRWIPLALLSVAMPVLVYLAVQQSQRRAADQPQVQIAEDAARSLERGLPPAALIPADRVDISRSLAPFTIIYDTLGKVLAGSGWLNDQNPVPPRGVIEFARTNGEHRVTWQPVRGVRIATVLRRTSNGLIVLAGRSLREVQSAIDYTQQIAFALIGFALVATLLAIVLGDLLFGADN
jgi:hypothetical protein